MPHLNKDGVWEPTPDFRGDNNGRKDYITREAIRWRDGFKNDQNELLMEGLMYFYLTMGNLKDARGQLFRPKWRDGDFFVLNHFLEARKNNKNLLVIKRREFGLTSLFGAAIPFHNCVTMPGTVNILTSASDDRLSDMRDNKIRPYRSTLIELGILPENHLDDSRRFSFAPRGSNVEDKNSSIRFMDTNKDDRAAQNMESQRAYYIFLDEYFLHNRAELVIMSANASMKKGEKQVGTMVLGGSCNNLNKESIPRLRMLLSQYESYNLDICFIPATYNYEPYEEKIGECYFSLHDKAREAILKERSDLRERKSYEILTNKIKSYPLSMKDLTSSEDANVLSGEIIATIEKSKEICMTLDEVSFRCRLVSTNKGIFPDADQHGNFVVYEHPQLGHTYIAGMDPIPYKIGASDKGSDAVCIIKDITTNQYVAYFSLRNDDPEFALAEIERLLVYYKSERYPLCAPCMVETNRGEVIMRLAILKGKGYMWAHQPGEKTPGYNKSIKERGILHSNMLNYLKYCGTICIHKFLDDIDKYPSIDSHIIDALQACEFFDSFRSLKKEEEKEPNFVQRVIRDGQGRTQLVWVPED